MATQLLTHENIVKTVQTWPNAHRLRLVQDILHSIEAEIEAQPLPKKTLEMALGLLATDNPPPTDEEVVQWLDEYRMEKYGS